MIVRRLIPLLAALWLASCAHQDAAQSAAATASPAVATVHVDPYTADYDKLHPAVAFITMKLPADDPKRKGQFDDAYGTGVVIFNTHGWVWILTDAHVVQDAQNLHARIGDAGKTLPATVVARSNDADDLALIKIPAPAATTAELGDDSLIAPGRAVGVIGYPIPDAFEDEHLNAVASLYTGRIASIRNGTLEMDAPIIPGESGGPVFDEETGKMIGIAESRFDDERAIGFATPIDVVSRFLKAHPIPKGQ